MYGEWLEENLDDPNSSEGAGAPAPRRDLLEAVTAEPGTSSPRKLDESTSGNGNAVTTSFRRKSIQQQAQINAEVLQEKAAAIMTKKS